MAHSNPKVRLVLVDTFSTFLGYQTPCDSIYPFLDTKRILFCKGPFELGLLIMYSPGTRR